MSGRENIRMSLQDDGIACLGKIEWGCMTVNGYLISLRNGDDKVLSGEPGEFRV